MDVKKRIDEVVAAGGTRDEKLQKICELLQAAYSRYSWVGFYIASSEKPLTLTLGPYVGAPTDHTEIPYGRGVCGQVALTQKTKLVSDVSQEKNYLSCSIDVKSEIVVPIVDARGNFVAQIDIDSHQKDAFTTADQLLLEQIAGRLSILF